MQTKAEHNAEAYKADMAKLAKQEGKVAAKVAEKPVAAGPLASANFKRGTTAISGTVVEVAPNPKRAGSRARAVYEYYRVGATVAEIAEALKRDGLTAAEANADLRYNVSHGYIVVE